MTTRRRELIWLLTYILALGGIVLLSLYAYWAPHYRGCSTIGRAGWQMRNLWNALYVWQLYNGHLPVLADADGAEQDVSRVFEFIVSQGLTDDVLENLIHDPWGNPYHVFFDTDADGRTEIPGKVIPEPVAIWSDGPDGVNEYGEGDDLSSWGYGWSWDPERRSRRGGCG